MIDTPPPSVCVCVRERTSIRRSLYNGIERQSDPSVSIYNEGQSRTILTCAILTTIASHGAAFRHANRATLEAFSVRKGVQSGVSKLHQKNLCKQRQYLCIFQPKNGHGESKVDGIFDALGGDAMSGTVYDNALYVNVRCGSVARVGMQSAHVFELKRAWLSCQRCI